ncbi:MAG: peptidoglycan synthetase [Bacteroidetes bacterium]|nr:peptidoglycan synthetase [Bacteroidota bacterium]
MRIHFISIGGSIMHNLAIALKLKGHDVSGSDDEIFEPAKSRLEAHGILPAKFGWDADRIQPGMDAIILGMHARKENPELIRAQELELNMYSFPEYIYLNSTHKTRVAIAGSHGKTTITSMVMHVMQKCNKNFDYMVGALVKGFEQGLKLTENADCIILEADEYLSSSINMEPKFLWYKPQIALISGIAWDHMNVFPTFEIYVDQFRKFIKSMPDGSVLVYFRGDKLLVDIVHEFSHVKKIAYDLPNYVVEKNQFFIQSMDGKKHRMEVYGSHNMLNMEGARQICAQLGIEHATFYQPIGDFSGAGKRLEKLIEKEDFIAFRDFAHAPSKVKATIEGIKDQYPGRNLMACLELHTFSSLNPGFIPLYEGSMAKADRKYVFINQEAVKLKQLRLLSENEVIAAFGDPQLKLFYDREKLESEIRKNTFNNCVLLLMSSGDFAGLNLEDFVQNL